VKDVLAHERREKRPIKRGYAVIKREPKRGTAKTKHSLKGGKKGQVHLQSLIPDRLSGHRPADSRGSSEKGRG